MITEMPLKYAVGATIRKLRHERHLKLASLSLTSHVLATLSEEPHQRGLISFKPSLVGLS
jgi:hypothetical protein